MEPAIAQAILGDTPTPFRLDGTGAFRAAAQRLAEQARYRLDIITPDLERAVYDHEAFVEAVKRLVTRRARALVRIVVLDSASVVKVGHRLIPLGYRLTSKIQFRRPGEDAPSVSEALLLADGMAVLRRHLASGYNGTVCFKAPREAHDLSAQFEGLWTFSDPDPYIRRLDI